MSDWMDLLSLIVVGVIAGGGAWLAGWAQLKRAQAQNQIERQQIKTDMAQVIAENQDRFQKNLMEHITSQTQQLAQAAEQLLQSREYGESQATRNQDLFGLLQSSTETSSIKIALLQTTLTELRDNISALEAEIKSLKAELRKG